MRVLLVASFAILAGGCGSNQPTEPSARRPPGKVEQPIGPPRAWLETQAGNGWLGAGSSCWQFRGDGLCADMIAPTCEQRGIPHFRVSSDETVRAHLGFDPEEASLLGELGDAAPAQLHGRILEWQVSQGGVFTVFAKGPKGDASYSGCADLTTKTS
jgi:hypothetical protein